MFDPLVFPCATGDENYIGGAVETIEGVRLIKQTIPDVKTVLGISNISFGLPAAAREVVNSVFLYYCTKAGLDLAIVNAEKLERFASHRPGRAATGRESAVQHATGRTDEPRRLASADARAEGSRSISFTSRPSPSISAAQQEAASPERRRPPSCRSTSGWPTTSSKARKTVSSQDLERKRAEGADAARHHQRAADDGNGRSRPPVQQQRADRGRSAAVRRSDEGRGQPSRAVHGEGRDEVARAACSWPRSRATFTTSARISSRSSSRTTAIW